MKWDERNALEAAIETLQTDPDGLRIRDILARWHAREVACPAHDRMSEKGLDAVWILIAALTERR